MKRADGDGRSRVKATVSALHSPRAAADRIKDQDQDLSSDTPSLAQPSRIAQRSSRNGDEGPSGADVAQIRAEAQVRPASGKELVARSRRAFASAHRRARRAGFSEREAPFAASAWLTLRFLRVAEPTVDEVRARMRSQYPWLYPDAQEAP